MNEPNDGSQAEGVNSPDTRPEELTVEQEARNGGWVPEGEWAKDNPPKNGFLSAEEFVKRGREIIPIVRAQNRDLTLKLTAMERQMKEMGEAARSLNDFNQRAIAKEKVENERLLQQLSARRDQAVQEGDAQTAVAADREIARIQATPAPPDPVREQMVNQWLVDNPWFQEHEDMQDWAAGFSQKLVARGYQPGPAILDAVAREARVRFADRIGGDVRPGTVNGAGRRAPPKGNKKTFDDLPQEARDEYRRFTKQLGVKMTPEQYLSQYEWD